MCVHLFPWVVNGFKGFSRIMFPKENNRNNKRILLLLDAKNAYLREYLWKKKKTFHETLQFSGVPKGGTSVKISSGVKKKLYIRTCI